jgi:hypothetical protein
MLLKEFSKPVTVESLNETLSQRYGQKLDVSKFTLEQLEDARNKLRTKLSQVETNESFDTVHNNDTYQKSKLFLDILNAEIVERSKAKPDFLDVDKDNNEKETFKKAVQDKEEMDADKKEPMKKAKGKAKTKTNEGAEEEATLVMASKDMVDRITGWMEDTAEMQTESMLELADKIRDEMGVEKSEEFTGSVKPALESLYSALESTRDSLTTGVAILTGEGAPTTMGDEVPDDDMDMEPTTDMDMDDTEADDPAGDEFAASDAGVGGEEEADREKRESLDLSRRLGLLLADSKKKD